MADTDMLYQVWLLKKHFFYYRCATELGLCVAECVAEMRFYMNVHRMYLFQIILFSAQKHQVVSSRKMLSLFSMLAVSDVSMCIGKDGKLSPCGPGNQAREKSR